NIGDALLRLGKRGEARTAYQRALAIFEKALGPRSVQLAYPLTGIGELELELRRPSQAIEALEKALSLRADPTVDPLKRAKTELALGKALWEGASDRARAVTLVTHARDAFSAARPTELAEARAWLSAHRVSVRGP